MAIVILEFLTKSTAILTNTVSISRTHFCNKKKFLRLQTELTKVSEICSEDNSMPIKFAFLHLVMILAMVVEVCYKDIAKVNSLWNEVYGIEMFFIFLSMNINLLKALHTCMEFGMMTEEMTVVRLFVMVIFFCHSVLLLVLDIIMVSSCAKIIEQLKESSLLCFELLLKLPFQLNSSEYEDVYNDVLLLELLVNQPVQFSAYGFFTVDYSLLFSIMGGLTSYLIVSIGYDKTFLRSRRAENSKSLLEM
ncbi:uncharacterized protein LOC108906943 [Anoplophora glabripennis]|uniref:uncharacterized protein LOC108906943 n=1 Tax=Anoplophora glabripennis TaxID=217634 RepID=UPI0008758C88|nr:uncharacterized protein LOC108906943 [Anoplophora glabripennis]